MTTTQRPSIDVWYTVPGEFKRWLSFGGASSIPGRPLGISCMEHPAREAETAHLSQIEWEPPSLVRG